MEWRKEGVTCKTDCIVMLSTLIRRFARLEGFPPQSRLDDSGLAAASRTFHDGRRIVVATNARHLVSIRNRLGPSLLLRHVMSRAKRRLVPGCRSIGMSSLNRPCNFPEDHQASLCSQLHWSYEQAFLVTRLDSECLDLIFLPQLLKS